MKATVVDLRRNSRGILSALARNERVVLTHRGRQRAIIVPCAAGPRPPAAQHASFGMWKEREDLADVAGHVRRLRQGRGHAV
jgi:antitoxin (DNA-binding transcriptional repressor) of toxin-antitoxin stability system